MNDTVLRLTGVCKDFPSASEKLSILDNLDMDIKRATRVIITGESGSGKSTLLNIIGGLETPTAGTIEAGPYRVESLDEKGLTAYRSTYLGLVFQFHYLLKDFTALENVMLPAYMTGMSKKAALERARALLVDVNLEHRMSHFPTELSGGERQRAAVARALVNNPELVLADEPTGNLDPANAALVKELLFSVVQRYNKTLLLVTHDTELSRSGDLCLRLHEGRLVAQ